MGGLSAYSRGGCFEPRAHLTAADETRLFEDGFAASYYNEIGNAAHAKTSRQIRLTLGIDFQDESFAGHFMSERFYLWSGGATGTAPGGPKVDQDRHGTFAGDFVKCSRITSIGSLEGPSGALQIPQRPVSARCLAGTRFCLAQDLQVIIMPSSL